MSDKLVEFSPNVPSLHLLPLSSTPHKELPVSANSSSYTVSPSLLSMELLAEASNISPRISFSHDLITYDVVPVEQRHARSDSSSLGSAFEFNLCSHENLDHESSSAEELFSEGKILPTPIKNKKTIPKTEEKQHSDKTEEKQSNDTAAKLSFWRLKRSSSGGYVRRLCPLPLLSRSYSTGSTKQAPLSKETHHYSKQTNSPSSSSSSSSPLKPPLNGLYRKPPLRKTNGVSSPALNVHSGNLFGLGSIIFNGKDKSKRK